MKLAAARFGNGETLPFSPCKKGYLPRGPNGERMLACPLHHAARAKRFRAENGKFRVGEVNLNLFWQRHRKVDACDDTIFSTDDDTEEDTQGDQTMPRMQEQFSESSISTTTDHVDRKQQPRTSIAKETKGLQQKRVDMTREEIQTH